MAVFAVMPLSDQPFSAQEGNGGPAPVRALESCAKVVKNQAASRFGIPDIDLRDIRIDNHAGRRDRVIGTFFLRRVPNRGEMHDFACSLDLDHGRVRSIEIDPGGFAMGDRPELARIAVQSCRRAVEDAMRSRGYATFRFGSVGLEGREVLGTVRGEQGAGNQSFDFGCRVDPARGNVLSVDLDRE